MCESSCGLAQATGWGAIVARYDELLALEPSPVAALNRAIALCMHAGPEAGLAALASNDEERRFLQRKLDEIG